MCRTDIDNVKSLRNKVQLTIWRNEFRSNWYNKNLIRTGTIESHYLKV